MTGKGCDMKPVRPSVELEEVAAHTQQRGQGNEEDERHPCGGGKMVQNDRQAT